MSLPDLPSLPSAGPVGSTFRDRGYKEASNVLKHIIGDQDLFEASRDHITEMNFLGNYPHFQAVYSMICVYYDDARKLPNRTTYSVELADHLSHSNIHEAQKVECELLAPYRRQHR
jgi:hypothetical protein